MASDRPISANQERLRVRRITLRHRERLARIALLEQQTDQPWIGFRARLVDHNTAYRFFQIDGREIPVPRDASIWEPVSKTVFIRRDVAAEHGLVLLRVPRKRTKKED